MHVNLLVIVLGFQGSSITISESKLNPIEDKSILRFWFLDAMNYRGAISSICRLVVVHKLANLCNELDLKL